MPEVRRKRGRASGRTENPRGFGRVEHGHVLDLLTANLLVVKIALPLLDGVCAR